MTIESLSEKLDDTDIIYRNGKPYAVVLELEYYKELLSYLEDVIDIKKAHERFSMNNDLGQKEIPLEQLKTQMLQSGITEEELIGNNS